MIKAICDKCGKEIIMKYYDLSLETPEGWGLEDLYLPAKREWTYRMLCPDCNPRIVRKVEKNES